MKVCSLFSGIGGIDLGFQQAGFEIVWANEFDRDAAKTYRHNFGDAYLSERNIRNVRTEDIPEFDVLVAGFPCQSFSSAGKQKGFDDPRGNLFFEIARIVRDKRPSVIFLENVANLLQHDDGKTFLTVYNTLVPFGYTFKYRVMDAMEYGNVPQHRSRIFIVAFLDYQKCEKFEFPEPIRRTVFLNDILQRNVKHDDSYYLKPGDPNYDFLVKLVEAFEISFNGFFCSVFYVLVTKESVCDTSAFCYDVSDFLAFIFFESENIFKNIFIHLVVASFIT